MEKLDDIFAKYSVSSEIPQKVTDGDKNARIEKLKKHLVRRELSEKRALEAVENMLKPGMDGFDMISEAPFIAQQHFEDVIEERAYVEHICGYPVCSNELRSIPSKDYHISSKVNAVFDIRERKKFCSLQCFRAATFFKQQLETGPIWLRDEETLEKLANIRLYDPKTDGKPSKPPSSTLDDEENVEVIEEPKKKSNKLGSLVFSALKKQENRRSTVDSDDEEVTPVVESDWKEEVWNCVDQWVTLETGLFLFGDEEVFAEKIRQWLEKNRSEDAVEVFERFRSKLRKSRGEQDGDQEVKKETKPIVPGVDEEMAAKIRAFYMGTMYKLGSEEEKKGDVNPDAIPIVCPVLPEKSPVSLRRKIFAEKVAKNGMQDMCGLLNIPWLEEVVDLLGECTKTLNLTSENVCLAPRGWKLASIILLRLLKHRSPEISDGWNRLTGAVAVDSSVLLGEEQFSDIDDRLMKVFVEHADESQLD